MKLYHASGSPNSRRLRMLIAEKGLGIELVPVDLGTREQLSDAYRAINPRAVVPALELDNGTVIAEAPVIMRYLDDAYPEVPLFGATPKEKAITSVSSAVLQPIWQRSFVSEPISISSGVQLTGARMRGPSSARSIHATGRGDHSPENALGGGGG